VALAGFPHLDNTAKRIFGLFVFHYSYYQSIQLSRTSFLAIGWRVTLTSRTLYGGNTSSCGSMMKLGSWWWWCRRRASKISMFSFATFCSSLHPFSSQSPRAHILLFTEVEIGHKRFLPHCKYFAGTQASVDCVIPGAKLWTWFLKASVGVTSSGG
jgi:hypothetical protein